MSDPDSSANMNGASPNQSRKREMEPPELPALHPADHHPDPAAEVDEDSFCETDTDCGRRVKPKLDLDPGTEAAKVNVNTEEDVRKKKSAELKSKVMNNTVVMTKVAKNLSARNLLDLRPTFTRWNHSFIPELRKKHKEIQLKTCEFDGKSRNTDDFIKLVRSSRRIGSEFPFSSYAYGADPPENQFDRAHDCQNFLELVFQFGSTITSLAGSWKGRTAPLVAQIRKVRRTIFGPRLPELMELSLELEPSFVGRNKQPSDNQEQLKLKPLPKLKRFTVTQVPRGGEDDADVAHAEFRQVVSEVIQWASGLEFLKIQDGTSNNRIIQSALAGLLLKSEKCEQHVKSLVVSSLKVADLSRLIDLARLKKNPLRLTCFNSDVSCPSEREEEEDTQITRLFHDFLVTQAPTVEELTLKFAFNENNFQMSDIRVPRMERVETFIFDRSAAHADPDPALPEVEFDGGMGLGALLRAFPALRRFAFAYCHDFLDIFEAEQAFHAGVEEFSLTADSRYFVAFTRFGVIFPSLTRLEVTLIDPLYKICGPGEDDNYILSEYAMIWAAWPNLTVVKLSGEFNGLGLGFSSFLTGVPFSSLNFMKQELDSLAINLHSLGVILAKYKTLAGLSNLKELRELTIDICSRHHNGQYLTDIGGYFGVALSSPHLQRVSIHGTGKNELSEQCLAFIKSTFGPDTEINL